MPSNRLQYRTKVGRKADLLPGFSELIKRMISIALMAQRSMVLVKGLRLALGTAVFSAARLTKDYRLFVSRTALWIWQN